MALRPTYAQLERMVEFIEETPELAIGQVGSNLGRDEAKQKWEELATILNSMEGQKKTTGQWSRFWADKKYSLKRRQIAQRNATAYQLSYGLDDEATPLSHLDDRIQFLVDGINSDFPTNKKETIGNRDDVLKPSTSYDSSAYNSQDSDNTKVRRSPRIRMRNFRGHANQQRQRLINIEEKRVDAETVHATGWYMTAKSLKHLSKAVVKCGQIIADAMVNRDG